MVPNQLAHMAIANISSLLPAVTQHKSKPDPQKSSHVRVCFVTFMSCTHAALQRAGSAIQESYTLLHPSASGNHHI